MKLEDIKLVGFIRLNPRGKALEEGRSWSSDGGRYNGYVAIPSVYEDLLDYDDDYHEYDLPPVSGGCTATFKTSNLQQMFASGIDTIVANPENVTDGGFIIVGFDTLHYNDTEAFWTVEQMTKEVTEWLNAIQAQIYEDWQEKQKRDQADNANKLHTINLNGFFKSLPRWELPEMTGYEPCTTFWQDFSIADVFVLNGMEPDAVQDTHNRSWEMVKNMSLGIKGLTEYIMVLNWKIHQHYPENMELSKLYDTLWKETDAWAMDNLKGEDLDYYIETTD